MARATTLDRVPLETVYEGADIVALLRVIEGKLLKPLADNCGVTYKGQVLKLYKGGKATELEFGHDAELIVGKRYLVFLTHPTREYRVRGSTNSISMQQDEEFEQRCASRRTAKKIMQGVHGAMVLDEVLVGDYADAIRVPTRFISLPQTLKITPFPPPNPEDYYEEPVWILDSELTNLLKQYSRDARRKTKARTDLKK